MKAKKKFKKLLSIAMATVLSIGILTGCSSSSSSSGSSSTQASTEDDTLVISHPQDVGTLNPHAYDSPMYVQTWVYEGLTKWEDNQVKPALAESWDISEDGKEYTFHLREGVKFTDGSDWNADVAKKNFDAVLKHQEDHSWLESLNEIKDVEVVDEYTIKVALKNAYYPILQELSLARPMTFGADSIFPDSGDTYTDGIKEAVGTGMWKLKEHKEGEYAIFERNDDYWGEKPSFKYVKVVVMPDANTATNALKSGEIDMIFDLGKQLTADAFEELKNAGFTTEISDPMSTLAIAVNSNRGATKDVKVRQALEYAVDKDSIITNVYNGLRAKCDTLFDKSLPYCDFDWPTYEYDVEKAKSLLDEAGWKLEDGAEYRTKDGETLTLEYCYVGTDNVSKTLGEVLQGQYKEIGVEVKLVGEESQSFNTRQKDGSFDLIVSETWGNQYDPHSMVASYREPSHADYRAQEGLPNKEELDQTVTDLLVETDENKRQEMYKEVLTSLQEQAVYIPICTTTVLAAHKAEITGVEFNTDNLLPLENVKREAK